MVRGTTNPGSENGLGAQFLDRFSLNTADLTLDYLTTAQAAALLEINPKSAGLLVRQGKLPGVKVANRWLIPRRPVEEFAKTYEGKQGRPRLKWKYTKASLNGPRLAQP